ncbi:hypothetical protein [Citrobacter phage CVT22]|uniref:Uncharacterized protein n=1 Tax=Citrobacter phage CVT22 TaxID=1622234 RepID=A0A0R6CFX2_9CAUD|nr:hypothetical protein APL39_gp79 [Citrobacter phage CVT22]AJT60782.1 hypothetical protein [Citrobacter phage CVT22]
MNITNPHSNLTPEPRVSSSMVKASFGITTPWKQRESEPKSYDGIPECNFVYGIDISRMN